MDAPGTHPAPTGGGSLLNGPFVAVLALALLGFSAESILRTAVPLMVLERGGDAVVVGLVAGAYALPSIVLRPLLGSLVDTWGHLIPLRLGALAATIVPLLHLLPGIVMLSVVRFAQGSGWATFAVADQTLMARLAPSHRRGEAAGYYMAMPAIATLVGPGAAVALFAATGEIAPVLLASALGLVAVAVALWIRVPGRAAAPASPSGGDQAAQTWRDRLVEPSALPLTVMLTAFMSAYSLFIVFPPVYALTVGAPIEILAIYYPVFGLAMTVSQFAFGRVSDRLGRAATIRIGCAVAIGGLTIAVLAQGMIAFAIASAGYGVAMSIVVPTISALTIDLAPAHRLGAAVATYGVGYQAATGLSGVLWGAVIAAIGFPWPFVVAIALQLVTLALSRRFDGRSRTVAA